MHLLFDLDGTLTDPAVGITGCLRHALVGLDHPVPAESQLRSCIGPPLQETFAILLDTKEPGLIAEAIRLYRERFGTVGMYENQVYPGIPEALTALRDARYRLFVATSKPTAYAAPILAHFDLADYFEGVYGSELTGERANKQELIAYLLAREGIPADTTVMIGDRRHDIEGGRRNALRATIGVTWG